ncbi:MAG: ATP-grasp domain-containing protein [Bacillota bacterium]
MEVALISTDPGREEATANPSGLHQMMTTQEAVHAALTAAGHNVQHIVLPPRANLDPLHRCEAEVVFNLVTGVVDKRMQLYSVALMEMTGLNFVGADLRTHVVCLDKGVTKALLRAGGIPTPAYRVIRGGQDPEPADEDLPFPVLVKPAGGGSSLGITRESVVWDPVSLDRRVEQLRWEFPGDIVVEQFLPGREFTVGILGNGDARVFPLQEITYANWPADEPPIYSFRAKVEERAGRECPARVDADLGAEIERIALATFRLLGLRDLARLDIRLDAGGRPHVLEVNALPGLQPGYSEYPRMAQTGGLSYEDLIDSLVQCCATRAKLGQ